jgi:hypothetical protein
MGSYTVERVQDGKVISRIEVTAGSGAVTVARLLPSKKLELRYVDRPRCVAYPHPKVIP